MTAIQRRPELDGIRGIAILLVVVWHYIAYSSVFPASLTTVTLRSFLKHTWAGVDLFFVLSGFLIGGILIDARSSPDYFKTFYIRRIARIVPLYFFVLLGFELARFVTNTGHTDFFLPLLKNPLPSWAYWLFLQNWVASASGLWGDEWRSVTWSLAVEEQFYLLLPVLIWLSPGKRLPLFVCLLTLAAPLLRVGILYSADWQQSLSTYWLTPCRFDALGLGVLAAIALRNRRTKRYLESHHRQLWQALGWSAVAVLYLLSVGNGVGTFHVASWGHFAFALLFFVLLLIVTTQPEGVLNRCFRHAPFPQLGILAYGIYLFHYPVLVLVHDYLFSMPPNIEDSPQVIATIFAFLITLVLAQISWRFLEHPCIRWGQRFKY